MTEQEFISDIVRFGAPLNIIGHTITEAIYLQKDISAKGVIIQGCIFEDDVVFNNIDLNCGVVFRNCIFKKRILFVACKATGRDAIFNYDYSHLEFLQTTISELQFGDINEIHNGVRIAENSTINILKVSRLSCSNGGFYIEDSTIHEKFRIENTKTSLDISIRGNTVINAKSYFDNNDVSSIVLTDAVFNERIYIMGGMLRSLVFNDGFFKGDISIVGVSIAHILTIVGSEFKKSINLDVNGSSNKKQGELKNVYISSGKFGNKLAINGGGCIINSLEIDTSKLLEGEIYVNSSKFLNVKISGNNHASNIVFNYCSFKELIFDNFYNYSSLSLVSVRSFHEQSKLIISHSDLGRTHLLNVFLDTFSKIQIYSSSLTEVVSSNVKWFSDDKLNIDDMSFSSDVFEQKREVYRQLKYASEKQGDRISSLGFKALEMKMFKDVMLTKLSWRQRLLKIDTYLLWAGQTNDFGLNWIKPIRYALITTLFLHFLIIVGVSKDLNFWFHFSYESIGLTYEIYRENLGTFFQMLDITHSINKVFPETSKLSSSVYFLDYLLKIILAFFVFQTVSAFRKYVK